MSTRYGDDPYARLDLARIRDAAEQHRCGYCGAQPGQPCHNTHTGQPLEKLPAHYERMREL